MKRTNFLKMMCLSPVALMGVPKSEKKTIKMTFGKDSFVIFKNQQPTKFVNRDYFLDAKQYSFTSESTASKFRTHRMKLAMRDEIIDYCPSYPSTVMPRTGGSRGILRTEHPELSETVDPTESKEYKEFVDLFTKSIYAAYDLPVPRKL